MQAKLPCSLTAYVHNGNGLVALAEDLQKKAEEQKEKRVASNGKTATAAPGSRTFKIVSRNPRTCRDIGYFEVYDKGFYPYSIIINTTPVGMFPDTENYIDLPYSTIEAHNIFIDLIYNPLETIFLKNGIKMGIPTFNGMKMLYEQAEAAWKIWQ